MMVLLTIVVVATLSLSTVTLRSVDRESGQAVARANARMALIEAIGQLQKEAGPDQRVTATAEFGAGNSNPNWTGVWKSDPDNLTTDPIWLVSGTTPKPDDVLNDSNSVVLASSQDVAGPNKELVRAKLVKVEGKSSGRFAYWVGDEGVKAKVDISSPEKDQTSNNIRLARAMSPQAPGITRMDDDNKEMWSPFEGEPGTDGYLDRTVLASLDTVSLAVNGSQSLPKESFRDHYFNDLTIGGFGLPVNVKEGGMKADLSLVFDRSSYKKPFVNNFLGASITDFTNFKSPGFNFGVSDKMKFGLSELITEGYKGAEFVGPNWGTLYSYGRLWERVNANNTAPLLGPNPLLNTDLRKQTWKPYARSVNPDAGRGEDFQHTNTALSPVVSMLQIGFYLGATDAGTDPKSYLCTLNIKPIIALWNPYNVAIEPTEYMLEWALSPYMRFDYQKANTNGSFDEKSGNVTEIWMREYWKIDGASFPTDEPGQNQGGKYLRLRTGTKVDFQPGEIRLFSVKGTSIMDLTQQYKNLMGPELDQKGVFAEQIKRSAAGGVLGQKAKDPLRVPSQYYGWFGDVFLQDTHWDKTYASTATSGNGTFAKFPKISQTASATWFTFKAIEGASNNSGPSRYTHLSRFSNLWNGGNNGKSKGTGFIPEPIYSRRNVVNVNDSAATRQAYKVDDLANGTVGHIGTWRFTMRNTTELEDPSQGLRGWIDSNPRVPVGNLRHEGSTNEGTSNFQGFNMISNMIGGASTKKFGDKAGGNRGLVAEGTWEASQRIPECEISDGRWRGFGGPTSSTGGYTHVAVYDVPRSPLTSVGQFQHAQLSRYAFEPGFVVGNSYANIRIPSDQITTSKAIPDGEAFNMVDISYEVNNKLWDKVFFSTASPDYYGASGSFDSVLNQVLSGEKDLPNPRMVLFPRKGDVGSNGVPSLDKIIADAGVDAPQAMASRILIDGAFNVNSTSKIAWKALLSTMGTNEMPWIDKKGEATRWTNPKGIRFSRFSHALVDQGTDGKSDDASFWQGWRTLDENELDKLAEAIVEEVKDRGPFRSMGDFVNRNPKGKPDHQRKGALQAALDKVANNVIGSDIGHIAGKPNGANFPGSVQGENQAAGHASYLLQGDVLQALSPVMQVRSDYFQIRACGEALDKNGKVIARAWCEAFVQRMPEYVDSSDKPEISFTNLSSPVNKTFGRKFQLVSFRWLLPSEV